MAKLEEESKETVDSPFGGTAESPKAARARRILETASLTGYRKRELFTVQEIGKAILPQQEQTQAKIDEQNFQEKAKEEIER